MLDSPISPSMNADSAYSVERRISGWVGVLHSKRWISKNGSGCLSVAGRLPDPASFPSNERAHPVCQIGPFVYEVGPWERPERPRLPLLEERIITKMFQFSPPTRFGTVYRDELARGRESEDARKRYRRRAGNHGHGRARHASARGEFEDGHRVAVTAKLFILAAGGYREPHNCCSSRTGRSRPAWETRTIWWVDSSWSTRITTRRSSFLPIATCLWRCTFLTLASHASGPVGMIGTLALPSSTLAREKIENCVFFFQPQYKTHADFQAYGVRSLFHMFHAVRQGGLPGDFMKRSVGILRDIDKVVRTGARMATGSRKRSADRWILRSFLEAGPNPESRVTLSERRDALGRNRVRLDWKMSELDRQSWRRAHEVVDEELQRTGAGRLHMTPEFEHSACASFDGWWKPITREPRGCTWTRSRGVVDENCKVHGIENLFIAGPSVFPTSGSANPVLTIVALALRLADCVKGILRGRRG